MHANISQPSLWLIRWVAGCSLHLTVKVLLPSSSCSVRPHKSTWSAAPVHLAFNASYSAWSAGLKHAAQSTAYKPFNPSVAFGQNPDRCLYVLPTRPAFATHTLQDKMDLAIGVALGSSIQIAIFVLPLVVIIGWIIGKPLTLDLDPFLILILTLSVIHANFVSSDGQSNWWVPASASACVPLLQAEAVHNRIVAAWRLVCTAFNSSASLLLCNGLEKLMALCRLVGVQLIGEALAHCMLGTCSRSPRVPWQGMLQAMLTASALPLQVLTS